MTTTTRETTRDRLALAREAGFGRLSLLAVVAGTLVAYGAFAVIAAIAGSIVEAVDAEANVSDYDWETVSLLGGLVLAVVMFLSYFFGGYVAGRMARRAALVHGIAVFVLGVVVAAVVGGLAALLTDTEQVQDNLRNVGIPTTGDDWQNLGTTIGGIVAVVLMLLGAILGAMKGERWHGKLLDRALDPEYGPEAERRRAAERETAAAQADWQRREQRMQQTDATRAGAVAPAAGAATAATAAHQAHQGHQGDQGYQQGDTRYQGDPAYQQGGTEYQGDQGYQQGGTGYQGEQGYQQGGTGYQGDQTHEPTDAERAHDQAEQQLAAERAARADDQIDLREQPVDGASSARESRPTDGRR